MKKSTKLLISLILSLSVFLFLSSCDMEITDIYNSSDNKTEDPNTGDTQPENPEDDGENGVEDGNENGNEDNGENDNESATSVTDIYNTWFAVYLVLTNFNYTSREMNDTYTEYLRTEAAELIDKTTDKLAVFKKDDGAFSYTAEYSKNVSNGMPVAIPNTAEGDTAGNTLAVTLVTYVMASLDLTSYTPAIFGQYDYNNYIKIIENNNLKATK